MTEQLPSADETLLIGRIVAPFGVHGQVKVRAYTEHVEHLLVSFRRPPECAAANFRFNASNFTDSGSGYIYNPLRSNTSPKLRESNA